MTGPVSLLSNDEESMSQISTFTIQRNGATIVQHLSARVEQASPMVSSDGGGFSPFIPYNIYFRGINPDARRGDYIIDEQNVNLLTNALASYKVRGEPEKFSTGMQIQMLELIDEVIPE